LAPKGYGCDVYGVVELYATSRVGGPSREVYFSHFTFNCENTEVGKACNAARMLRETRELAVMNANKLRIKALEKAGRKYSALPIYT
jgi:hypothetical protein